MLKLLGQHVFQEVKKQARAAEAGVQTVVEVIAPGPFSASKIKWDAATRARAEAAVQRAIRNWKQQQRQQQQEARRAAT